MFGGVPNGQLASEVYRGCCLVRSRLGATEHPRYTSLASWPLRTPPAAGPATGPVRTTD